MSGTDQAVSNSITLKGSAQLISEFFYYGLNNILYQRGIYPSESFSYQQKYGMTLLVTSEKRIKDYIDYILKQIKGWLEEGQIQRLVLVIIDLSTKETLERWEFNISTDKSYVGKGGEEKTSNKDVKEIRKEMQDVMRQITASVTFLPLLDTECSFTILAYTDKDTEAPHKWGDSSPCLIENAEEVKFKSFSTSIQRVEPCVTYKVD